MQTPADRIKEVALASGVPERRLKRVLADLCGVTYQAVAQWFDGQTNRISPEYLSKIANEYGVSMEYLVNGTGKQGRVVRQASTASERAERLIASLEEEDLNRWLQFGEALIRTDRGQRLIKD
jgi:transcriptional regulator with XRE-family HTH domain